MITNVKKITKVKGKYATKNYWKDIIYTIIYIGYINACYRYTSKSYRQ